jgi:hypothetical protein
MAYRATDKPSGRRAAKGADSGAFFSARQRTTGTAGSKQSSRQKRQ